MPWGENQSSISVHLMARGVTEGRLAIGLEAQLTTSEFRAMNSRTQGNSSSCFPFLDKYIPDPEALRNTNAIQHGAERWTMQITLSYSPEQLAMPRGK